MARFSPTRGRRRKRCPPLPVANKRRSRPQAGHYAPPPSRTGRYRPGSALPDPPPGSSETMQAPFRVPPADRLAKLAPLCKGDHIRRETTDPPHPPPRRRSTRRSSAGAGRGDRRHRQLARSRRREEVDCPQAARPPANEADTPAATAAESTVRESPQCFVGPSLRSADARSLPADDG